MPTRFPFMAAHGRCLSIGSCIPMHPLIPTCPPYPGRANVYREIEEVTIRGKPMLMKVWVPGSRIHGFPYRCDPVPHGARADTGRYCRGRSHNRRVSRRSLQHRRENYRNRPFGTIAGAIGSTTGGYGVYATTKRLIVVHNRNWMLP